METAGIIAEYNPFHRGHAWHMAETRRRLGGGAVVCVMSGHWVQRGECALTDKWSRAAAALMGGADLVVELPTPWAMASAESFARGAVALLAATGVVDVLSFGSEAGELAPLEEAVAALDAPDYPDRLRAALALASPSRRPGRRRRGGWPACPSPTTTWGWSTCGPSGPWAVPSGP